MSRRAWGLAGGAAAGVAGLLGILIVFIAVATGAGSAQMNFAAAASSSVEPAAAYGGGDLKAGSVPAADEPWIRAAAAACPGLPAPVLAAQLNQESGFAPDATSSAGAEGIAQFMPDTWETWKVDADRDGTASVWSAPDAITAQGRFMCALLKKTTGAGYPGVPIELALAGYNAGWAAVQQYGGVPPTSFAGGQTANYVKAIMASARNFTAPTGADQIPAEFALPADTPPAVRIAIGWALNARGGWYSYGGTCTKPLGNDPARRCDCSSLIQQAYHAAGVALPRTTADQVHTGTAASLDAPLPGDLVFSPGVKESDGNGGSASRPGHVALYLGGGWLLEAPHTGAQIRVVSYASWRTSTSTVTRAVAVRRVVSW
ncbi:MAG: transglycosylase SLT domain-containing protein [Streptomyces sp.]|nr:transglycosylase SLT domain-containing protein [Streptomyces sp.]